MDKIAFQVVSGRVSGATWCPSPNFNARPVGEVISLLVVHNISLPPGQFLNGYVTAFFQNRLPVDDYDYFREIHELRVSAHLFVDRKGGVTQFVNLNDRAWHAGVSCFEGREQCNDFSIGIELEGTDEIPYTDAQYQALKQLTLAIQSEYPRITSERITGHSDIAPHRKTDPGPAFDWEYYRRLIS